MVQFRIRIHSVHLTTGGSILKMICAAKLAAKISPLLQIPSRRLLSSSLKMSGATSDAASAPAKRSDPPPPADLSKPNAGERPFKRVRENKFDPTVLPQSSDEAEIIK